MSLRQRLADYGFESNDDYDFPLRCLFEATLAHLRVLHVEGHGGRRKTAFANALAHALEYDHVLYHDFSREEPPAPAVVHPEDPTMALEPGLSAFERALVESCAYSEAARTVLILDQLQAAPFADHLRLVRFVESGEWSAGTASVTANARHFLLVLISEDEVYHSLARLSYRIWTDAERGGAEFRPEDFGLPAHASALLDSLAAVFTAIGASPTPSEMRRVLDDLLNRVGSEEQLRHSLFGWVETAERKALLAPALAPLLRATLDALEHLLGADRVELGGS